MKVGLGLRPELWQWTIEHAHALDAVELIVDDVLHLSPSQAADQLAPVRDAGLDIVVHGVDLSLASVDGPDRGYVTRVGRILDALGATTYSEHCSYHRLDGRSVGQFMPVPFTQRWAQRVADSVRAVQDILGRRMLIENVAYLVEHPRQGLGEAAFLAEVCARADCGLLLDLENVAVNAANLDYDPLDLLADLPLDRVAQLHLAGGQTTAEGIAVDSHSAPVRADVLELLSAVAPRLPAECVAVVERDKGFPDSFAPLLAEFEAIREAASQGDDGPLEGRRFEAGEDFGADAMEAAEYQRQWVSHFQMPPAPGASEYVLGIPEGHRDAFARVLRTKRRDKLEPLLPGTWRCLGELDRRDALLKTWFRQDSRQDLSRVDEVAGFAAVVAETPDLPEALHALTRHEATLVELRAKPFTRWNKLIPHKREVASRFRARDLDAVAAGASLPEPLPRTARVRYTRRAEGVWVEDL